MTRSPTCSSCGGSKRATASESVRYTTVMISVRRMRSGRDGTSGAPTGVSVTVAASRLTGRRSKSWELAEGQSAEGEPFAVVRLFGAEDVRAAGECPSGSGDEVSLDGEGIVWFSLRGRPRSPVFAGKSNDFRLCLLIRQIAR